MNKLKVRPEELPRHRSISTSEKRKRTPLESMATLQSGLDASRKEFLRLLFESNRHGSLQVIRRACLEAAEAAAELIQSEEFSRTPWPPLLWHLGLPPPEALVKSCASSISKRRASRWS